MFGSGLQVDRGSSSNTRNVYVPPVIQGKGRYFSGPHRPPPFLGTWEDMENRGPLGMGVAAKDAFVEHALPWMGRKAVEMERYGASEALRNKKLQKKAVNYGINKLTPFIQESVGTAMDQLSTKVRPKKKYKTDRKDLDGRTPDIAMKTTQKLIPSLKPVYDRYRSGDVLNSAFGSEHGVMSSKFWRRPTAAEEKAKGIIRKGRSPELFFAFNRDGKKIRQYKTKFFEKNPEASVDMHNIISGSPDT
ncbi:unnamed protein product [Porites evermanni]|uniref:Uncharacterized protein n=1 Tax=Porites evermanni TaxID=104178 RepID=A0ABN8LMP6_9CNID|nr:unnamed protein product [Porites evermanni]